MESISRLIPKLEQRGKRRGRNKKGIQGQQQNTPERSENPIIARDWIGSQFFFIFSSCLPLESWYHYPFCNRHHPSDPFQKKKITEKSQNPSILFSFGHACRGHTRDMADLLAAAAEGNLKVAPLLDIGRLCYSDETMERRVVHTVISFLYHSKHDLIRKHPLKRNSLPPGSPKAAATESSGCRLGREC